MKDLIKRAWEIAYKENQETSMPVKEHIDLSVKVGLRLAEELKANKEIVEIGTLMMDSMIGQAMKIGKIQDHVEMSKIRTQKLLAESEVEQAIKENILQCVLEHHGSKKFYSLESEICCNADCFRFISIKGFTYAVRFIRDMDTVDLVKILKNKVEEKWNALTLETCKKELEPQYLILKNYLKFLDG